MENKKIVDYLLGCGIKPNIKGFEYLYTAIEITIRNDYKMPQVTKFLYPTIAEMYNDTPSKVERACRHSISISNKEFKHMTCGEFIARAAISMKFAKKKEK